MKTICRYALVLITASTVFPGTRTSPAAAAQNPPAAQLGFILFCKTAMSDVTARLGPGTRFTNIFFVWRGWYDPAARVYFLIASGETRGPTGSPLVIQTVLAREERKDVNLDDARLKAQDLGRPRLSLTSLRGPKGIGLGDSRVRVFALLGAGELQDCLRANVETYNYYLPPAVQRPGCGEAGFFSVQVSFTDGKLTRLWIIEGS